MVGLIEDEPDLAAMLAAFLDQNGFRVVQALDATAGADLLTSETLDLIVLDLGLPDGNGFDLLRSIRRNGDVPVIIVTGRGEEPDRVIGLELGADDYLVKPFSARELTARIRAVLRRTQRVAAESSESFAVIRLGDMVVDTAAREVRSAERVLALSPREYALLEFFAAAPRQVFSAEQLLDAVWGDSGPWLEASTVSEHIYRLRRKLASQGVTRPRITTVRGFGYRLDP